MNRHLVSFFLCAVIAVLMGACVPGNTRGADQPTQLVLDMTGNIAGTVEPCGCVKGQLGGLARRMTAIQDARNQYKNGYLYVDYGNLLFPSEPSNGFDKSQRALRARALASLTGRMKPDAYNLAVEDFEGGINETVALLRSAGLPLVSANLRDGDGRPLAPASISLVRNGLRIAITGFAEPADDSVRLPSGLHVLPVLESLRQVVPGLKKSHDLVIVLSHGGSITQSAVAEAFGPVVVAGARYDTMGLPVKLSRDSAGVGATTLGRHIARFILNYSKDAPALYDATSQKPPAELSTTPAAAWTPSGPPGTSPFRLLLMPIDGRIFEQPDIRREIDRMKQKIVEQATAEYGAIAAEAVADERSVYAGNRTCQTCHQIQYEYWAKHPHSRAMDTLRSKNSQNDATCIGCHSVGYNEPGGYRGTVVPIFFENVQCESCHTGGARHVSDVLVHKPNKSVPKETCLKCHGAFHEQKPFQFEKMLPLASCPSAARAEPVTPSPDQEPGTGDNPASKGTKPDSR